jgi:hypothetical protein
MLSVIYAECRYAEYRKLALYAEHRYAECPWAIAKCLYAKLRGSGRYAECLHDERDYAGHRYFECR